MSNVIEYEYDELGEADVNEHSDSIDDWMIFLTKDITLQYVYP